MNQLAWDFERPAHQGPIVPESEVDRLIAKLRGRGWRTAKQLGAVTESERRMLRATAEESEGQILSGQKGYKLTIEATESEIEHAGWLRSQGKKMVHRWIQIRRVWRNANEETE